MRILLVFSVLATIALAEDTHCKCDYGDHASSQRANWAPLLHRTEAHELRISRLQTKLDDVLHKLTDGKQKVGHALDKFHELVWRVDKLEGKHCADSRHFQCGDELHHCISDLEVCDGVEDCKNGHDEDESTCENLVPAGSHFEAEVDQEHDHCTQRRPHKLELLITSVKRLNFFAPRLKVKADITLHFHEHDGEQVDTLHVEGYYNFGGKLLVLDPPESDRLGIRCHFDGFHHDQCNGAIVRESTLESCADFIWHRTTNRHRNHH